MSGQEKITGKQIAAGRVLAGVARAKLAGLAGISEADLKLMEANDGPPGGNAERVRDALEKLGVVFIPENGGGAGVRLKFNRSEVKQIARLEGEGGAVADDDV